MTAKHGGHVAFVLDGKDWFWADKQVLEFCTKQKGEDKPPAPMIRMGT